MKRKVINENGRDKAFIGAAIGAVGNIVGGIIGRRKQKKAAEKAYRQAQEEQTRSEGIQQAAAMSAQYANQDYVDQYREKITLKNGGKVGMKKKDNDRVAIAKRYKCGGRKKSNLGSEIVSDIKNIGQEFKGNNLGNTIVDSLNAVGNTINASDNPVRAARTSNLSSTATTASYIKSANDIAQQAEARKQQRTTAARCGTKKKFACGGRKKGMFGIGSAISGIGSIVSSATQSTTPQKQIKKADGFSYQAPKTGLEQNSYKTDANGNPVNAINVNNAAQPTYADRIQREMRIGGRKRKACGGKR